VNPFAAALGVANAVLYEGYILYPYTASARKNKLRWQFGVIVPQAYAASGTGESSYAQTEILLDACGNASLEVMVRFLQVETRSVEIRRNESFEPVESMSVSGEQYVTFDEGIERQVDVSLKVAAGASAAAPIAFAADQSVEALRDDAGSLCGRVLRRRWPLHGAVIVDCMTSGTPGLYKVRVRIENHSSVVPGERSAALRTAFVSTHVLLHAQSGRFLSALDPPAEAMTVTATLRNAHTWPVLIDDPSADAQRSALVLSSPIILYDFPAVARQSAGDTCDATEIDELMMLSVLSLSDAEREEARATDSRARAIVERAERFDSEELRMLHGITQTDVLASLDVPALDCVFVNGEKVTKGSVVRLHPKRRADVWDAFLEQKLATVRAIHQDVENQMYVAVTVDDDPASDMHQWYGRSLFFYPDEVEPLGISSEARS
jgi:hypothetical protein